MGHADLRLPDPGAFDRGQLDYVLEDSPNKASIRAPGLHPSIQGADIRLADSVYFLLLLCVSLLRLSLTQ